MKNIINWEKAHEFERCLKSTKNTKKNKEKKILPKKKKKRKKTNKNRWKTPHKKEGTELIYKNYYADGPTH